MAVLSRAFNVVRQLVIRQRRIAVTLVFLLQVALANYAAFIVRFDGRIPEGHADLFFRYFPLIIAIRLFLYLWQGLHKDLWRYAGIRDLVNIIVNTTIGSVIFIVIVRYMAGSIAYPRSIYILDWVFLILMSGGLRLAIRVFKEYLRTTPADTRVIVIGAGDAGEMIVRDMNNNPGYDYNPLGFIDDDRYKKGLSIHGVPILGTMEGIEKIVSQYDPDEFLIAIPSASNRKVKDIYEKLAEFKLPIKTLPGLSDILKGNLSISQIKPLSMEDLLQRQPVRTDIESVKEFITGKRVLVTGAGGSIGSELARQIALYQPEHLLLIDRYENGLYQTDLDVKRIMPEGCEGCVSLIRDVTDRSALDRLFEIHKVQIVFHAAAHKHVPLMQDSPLEAIKNNVFGTKNLIEISSKYNAEHFVMISTDKAVNPTNIMGATKRIAEFLALRANAASETKFTTVRFGNVLGSNGSVFHVFDEQLKRGGPITVTHPDITRYFMLIPEAVQLVLMAASSGKGGEIFVLEMGEPIKIVDFAEQFIRLSGMEPHEDIEITFTGLRPGEKLYEELFDTSERMVPTDNESFQKAIPQMPAASDMDQALQLLASIIKGHDESGLKDAISQIVPGYNGEDTSVK
jgi:FlaA1/EpsC-like NDP-sugar epimerase